MPPAPGIAVEGTGEVHTIPDVVEINLRLVARGELTDDAVVKHRDARKRTLETFQGLKLDNLKLEEKDLTLRPGNSQEMMQMMMWGGMPASQNKRTQIEVSSMLRARLTNVSKMPTEELMSTIGKLIDTAQDSGAGLGVSDSDMMMMRWYGNYNRQSSIVKFIVTNLDDHREKAYELAVADARKRAERLARLNGVKLGARHRRLTRSTRENTGAPFTTHNPVPTNRRRKRPNSLRNRCLEGASPSACEFASGSTGQAQALRQRQRESGSATSTAGKSP